MALRSGGVMTSTTRFCFLITAETGAAIIEHSPASASRPNGRFLAWVRLVHAGGAPRSCRKPIAAFRSAWHGLLPDRILVRDGSPEDRPVTLR